MTQEEAKAFDEVLKELEKEFQAKIDGAVKQALEAQAAEYEKAKGADALTKQVAEL